MMKMTFPDIYMEDLLNWGHKNNQDAVLKHIYDLVVADPSVINEPNEYRNSVRSFVEWYERTFDVENSLL